MIVGCYVLHLYCDFCELPQGRDTDGCAERKVEFTGDSKQDSYRRARKHGWGINESRGTAMCPTCAENQ